MSESISAQLKQCHVDTKAVLGKQTAAFLANHGIERTTETARIAFIKTAVRNGNPQMARKLHERGCLSLEQIVLDHPDCFSADDVEIARGNLGIQAGASAPAQEDDFRAGPIPTEPPHRRASALALLTAAGLLVAAAIALMIT